MPVHGARCLTAVHLCDNAYMRVIVYRGHTVVTPGGACKPGDMVGLSDGEAQRLIALGIVHRPGEQVMVRDYAPLPELGPLVPRDLLRANGTRAHTYQPAPAIVSNTATQRRG